MDSEITPYSLGAVFVQSRDKLRLISQIDQLVTLGSSASLLMTYQRLERQWFQFSFDWTAVSLALRVAPLELYILGMGGEVYVVSASQEKEENVDSSLDKTKENIQFIDPR